MLGHHRRASETPFKWRFSDGDLLAGRWWPAYSGILILPPLINLKEVVKVGPPPIERSGSAHVISRPHKQTKS